MAQCVGPPYTMQTKVIKRRTTAAVTAASERLLPYVAFMSCDIGLGDPLFYLKTIIAF